MFSFLIKKGEESGITYELSLNESIQAPISQGQILGTVTYSLNGSNIGSVDLVAEKSIDKINLMHMCKHVFNSWFKVI